MSRGARFLQSAAAQPPEAAVSVESDFVVILAALLCGLICVVGLVAIVRCAWLRRGTAAGEASTAPAPAPATKGLKKKVVNSLPKFTYADGVDRCKWGECAICLTEFAAGDEVRSLPQCGHAFHVACVDTWLASHSSCPSCRAPFAVARCQKCGHYPAISAAAEPESKSVCGGNANSAAASSNANCNVIIANGFSNYGFLP